MRGDRSTRGSLPAVTGIPPNEVAKFPLSDARGARNEPADCPLYGMSLVPILGGIRTTLHDALRDGSRAVGDADRSRAGGPKSPLRAEASGDRGTSGTSQIVHEHRFAP